MDVQRIVKIVGVSTIVLLGISAFSLYMAKRQVSDSEAGLDAQIDRRVEELRSQGVDIPEDWKMVPADQ